MPKEQELRGERYGTQQIAGGLNAVLLLNLPGIVAKLDHEIVPRLQAGSGIWSRRIWTRPASERAGTGKRRRRHHYSGFPGQYQWLNEPLRCVHDHGVERVLQINADSSQGCSQIVDTLVQ